ncbi:hypothetical protein [Heyndrickxia acidicola]|uniref:Uncharacterized protein n=1 Tax=Heyndrickxia acidicola TaxID=209389 RepID=A0ABU6MMC0_9BACI|nr:hypothetical protein [Heyndrickxia acidicola]MED1205834.1 hypothetical protein [Heyndrickxia acidicola]
MKCLRCGVAFDPSDILVNEESDEILCDRCAIQGEAFMISHEGKDFFIQASDFIEAIQKWKLYVERKQLIMTNRFSPDSFELKRITEVILN